MAQGMARDAKKRLKNKSRKAPSKTKKRDLPRVLPMGTKLAGILKPVALIQGYRKIVQYEDGNLSWQFNLTGVCLCRNSCISRPILISHNANSDGWMRVFFRRAIADF